MKHVTLQLPTLYPQQRAAFYDPARLVVIEASTKAGKSVGALRWLMESGCKDAAPGTALWCSPIYRQAEVMFERCERMLTRSDPTKESGWDSNKSKLVITLPGGRARIAFRGSDNPDSIYGSDHVRAVVDEASRCREDAWHAVRSTLTSTEGQVRLIGNVKGRKNWAYRLARKAQAGEPNMAYHKITAGDAVAAGVISQSELDDAKRVYPPMVFRELYYCEPSDDGGCPFDDAAITRCLSPLSKGEPSVWGVDLAKSRDWCVAIALDEEGHVCRFERWQGDWSGTIAKLSFLIGDTPALIDNTGVGNPIVEKLQTICGGVTGETFSATTKQSLMSGLAQAIQSEEIAFPEGVIEEELRSFEYVVRLDAHGRTTGVTYSAPAGSHDDCVCALSLAVKHRHATTISAFDFRVIAA